MNGLSSVEELAAFRRCILSEKKAQHDVPTLVVCAGTGGQASGANDILRAIKRHILDNDLQGKVHLRITGCQGFCEMDPFVLVNPGSHLYPKLAMGDVPRVIDAAVSGKVDEALIYRDGRDGRKYPSQNDIAFFKHQTRTILGSNEKLDPIRIRHYLAQNGYVALERVLSDPDPDWIIEEVKASGLRGRGGAGFPTGVKWERARASGDRRTTKYIICNADEGDPGAYMDRSLLEGNPHAIIEGMLIAGIAIGARRGIIYVRSEYPLAVKHTLIALRRASELGILGKSILGTGISFDIEVVRGAGAFVCGEETALIRSIEGFMGEPRQRPPYPIERGLNGCPTCINNVETLANVPVIIRDGAEQYARVGVPGNTGTKIFSLVGKVRNTGLVEVPLGIPLRDIIYKIGGGSPRGARIKAVQTGGPSGGCIPASMFDIPVDYDSLASTGSIMGSGGMIVMDESTCIIDVARYYMGFLKDESCGKCFTCRKGTQRMFEILDDITKGRAGIEALDLLEELALAVADTTMCGLGQSAPNPVLSTLRYFREEYVEHAVHKRCRAGVCTELVGAPCQAACPVGTEAWRYVAHIERGEFEKAYEVIRAANPLPSVCARVCHHPCEEMCRLATTGASPVAVRALKRFVTDTVDPSGYQTERKRTVTDDSRRVAVVGAGPAGLTAAHYLSLDGFRVTVFEAESEPGGMLVAGVPSYRLPRSVARREIAALLDEHIEMRCETALGRDFTVDSLFEDGYQAVFLALGAHHSRRLALPGEDAEGVHSAVPFLKAFNMRGETLAKGKVGVVGGGNSAVDAARVALRQEGVDSVTVFYRRTREEMPAIPEEVEAAIEEGVRLETLLAPIELLTPGGRLQGIEFVRNRLGDFDDSGRPRPVPIEGSRFSTELDTLVVAIGEKMEPFLPEDAADSSLIKDDRIEADRHILATKRAGVFAGGDAATGPNTVIDAIAAGKRAAIMIGRYLRGEDLDLSLPRQRPEIYVEPRVAGGGEPAAVQARVEVPTERMGRRRTSFAEVELALSVEQARCEAGRCLRCDLDFTTPGDQEGGPSQEGEPA
ncbi:MAG: FAD-dependent oxidoreductase [Planctomycetota bacterium]|jgi:NADH-quinone oxidoreductase subunit F